MDYPDNLFLTIDESLAHKKIVARMDINASVNAQGTPTDTARIDAALSVLSELSGRQARVVVLAHFGEKGESLEHIASFMKERIANFSFLKSIDRSTIEKAVNTMQDGEILLLENVRMFPGETENEDGLARFFASLGNIFVNDAFPVSHREHASVCGVTKHVKSFFGPIMRHELTQLSKALTPEFPCLLILGGAKLSTKLPLIEIYLKKGCFVYVGGAMVHNIIKEKGYEIGESLYDKDYKVSDYVLTSDKLLIPTDVILNDHSTAGVKSVPKTKKIYDCGPKTIATLREVIGRCHTVIMNGPVGYYEGGFDEGTSSLLSLMEKGASLTSIIGGGDTLTVYNSMAKKPKLSFVSLGGGAMLDFLKDGTLPGLRAVVKNHDRKA
jgi:phosphoglycerate kinase